MFRFADTSDPFLLGETFHGGLILIKRGMADDVVRGTIIHEVVHFALVFASDDEANLAIDCLPTANDDDSDGDTTYNQGGGGNRPKIISKNPHVSIPRVWVIRYIPAGGGNGPAVSIGELEVTCDYDTDDDVWDDCPDTYPQNADES